MRPASSTLSVTAYAEKSWLMASNIWRGFGRGSRFWAAPFRISRRGAEVAEKNTRLHDWAHSGARMFASTPPAFSAPLREVQRYEMYQRYIFFLGRVIFFCSFGLRAADLLALEHSAPIGAFYVTVALRSCVEA